MADEALALAYPKERSGLDFYTGRFSRDGAFLALVLRNIRIGDPEQVWLYELRSQRLIPVTEPHETFHILDLAWSKDGTLYTSTERGLSATQPFGTNMARTREIGQLPREIIDIFNQSSKRFHFGGEVDCCEEPTEQNGNYAVRVTAGSHGIHTLWIREANGEWTDVADGGFELLTFIFDPVRSVVLYPALGKIVALDLQTHQSRSVLALKNPVFPYLLDQTGDGTVVAYIEPGDCLLGAQSDDELRIAHPRRVCFAEFR